MRSLVDKLRVIAKMLRARRAEELGGDHALDTERGRRCRPEPARGRASQARAGYPGGGRLSGLLGHGGLQGKGTRARGSAVAQGGGTEGTSGRISRCARRSVRGCVHRPRPEQAPSHSGPCPVLVARHPEEERHASLGETPTSVVAADQLVLVSASGDVGATLDDARLVEPRRSGRSVRGCAHEVDGLVGREVPPGRQRSALEVGEERAQLVMAARRGEPDERAVGGEEIDEVVPAAVFERLAVVRPELADGVQVLEPPHAGGQVEDVLGVSHVGRGPGRGPGRRSSR